MPLDDKTTMKKEIIIDGNNFRTLDEFYDEVVKKITVGFEKGFGRNLAAYNDVLRGGFRVHEYEEPIRIKWTNSNKSKRDLGQAETIKFFENALTSCHPTNIPSVEKDLENAKNGRGEMLFDIIVDITNDHGHIELILD